MAEARMPRRLAAILAADVVGYSRLMGADESGTLAALNAHRTEFIHPTVSEYGGRIVKLMGDGVLAEFASVVDAVECAVAVQHGMEARNAEVPEGRRIAFRIGINLGDIIIEGDDIYGDGVNVAARLEAEAEPGGVCLSGDAFRQVQGKLDLEFEDLGERSLKNIAGPVHAYRWSVEKRQRNSGAGVNPPLPDKPSIAVLPFENMSGDPEQEYFADGIAEDLITALGRFRWFFVIARNSSFAYKGKAVDIKQVARELGVRYVIEGSVRKAGNRVRITAQLVEAASGRHVCAERYDRELSDILEVQDEITTAISGTVGPSFAAAEAQRAARKAPDSLDAWDLAMRATAHVANVNKADLAEARRLFRQAVERDPNGSYALSGLAMAYLREAGAGLADDISLSREEADRAARRALELDDRDAVAHLTLARVHHTSRNNELARKACIKALELNPNLAEAEAMLGLICAHLAEPEEARIHIDKAMRLSPRDPSLQFWNLGFVIAALVAGDPEAYLGKAQHLTEDSPGFIPGWRHLVAAYANLDRLEEAKAAVTGALKLFPNDSIAAVLESVPVSDPGARERYIAGLRKAGYPE